MGWFIFIVCRGPQWKLKVKMSSILKLGDIIGPNAAMLFCEQINGFIFLCLPHSPGNLKLTVIRLGCELTRDISFPLGEKWYIFEKPATPQSIFWAATLMTTEQYKHAKEMVMKQQT